MPPEIEQADDLTNNALEAATGIMDQAVEAAATAVEKEAPLTPEQQAVIDNATEEERDLSEDMMDELMDMLADFIPELETFFATLIDSLEEFRGDTPDDEQDEGSNSNNTLVAINLLNEVVSPDTGLTKVTSNGLFTMPNMPETDSEITTQLEELKNLGVNQVYTTEQGLFSEIDPVTSGNAELGFLPTTYIAMPESAVELNSTSTPVNYETLYRIYNDGNLVIVGEKSKELSMLMYAISTPGITEEQLATDFDLESNLDEFQLVQHFIQDQQEIRTAHPTIPQMPAETVEETGSGEEAAG